MAAHVIPLSLDFSQLRMFPVYPVTCSVPLLMPLQTVASLETPPPLEAGVTAMVASAEFVVGQEVFCTTAL